MEAVTCVGVSDTLVLCYHAVSDGWPSGLSVTPAALERQLAILLGRGYRGVTFTEAVEDARGSGPCRSRSTTRSGP